MNVRLRHNIKQNLQIVHAPRIQRQWKYYLVMLQEFLYPRFEQYPIGDTSEVQQDCVNPIMRLSCMIAYLHDIVPCRCIGRERELPKHYGHQDLTHMDLGFIESKVYTTNVQPS